MKLWGGRFGKATDGLVDDFHSSISFDQRLFEQDITGSIAHATMLGEQGIIPAEDAEKIVEGPAIFGGANAFIESTLAQIYKKKADDGTYYGGPSYYMQNALGHLL